MPRYVALFRGINVGKAKRIAMGDLRALLDKLGYADVATLLNSGNAVFTANAEPAVTHAARIREAVQKKLGVDALVIVKSAKDVAAIVTGNALAKHATDDSKLLIAVTNEPKLTLDQIRAAIKAKGLPNLAVPREIQVVHEIPKLGTGKVNHRELAKIISATGTSPVH